MNLGMHLRLGTVGIEVPALALDFVSAPILSSAVTFSRSSAATTVGQDGLIQTVAVDAPRFDFDPATLAPRGLLVEEARTNLFVNSLVNGDSLATQNVSVTAVPHTISFYGTGTITLSGAATASVVGTGAYPNRRTLTFTPTLGVLVCTVVGLVQFAQLEVGSFATSFIPTGALPVTRAADIATMTGSNFSSWYNQSQGTFVTEYDILSASFVAAKPTAAVHDGTASNRVYGYVSTAAPTVLVSTGGAAQASITGSNVSANVKNKMAFAYLVNNIALSSNGGAVGTDLSATIPTVDRLNIGSFSPSSVYLNGHVRSIIYYSTRLANGVLQRLCS